MSILIENTEYRELLAAKAERDRLDTLVNNPQTDDFLTAVRAEMAHQVERWGDAHDRGKSAENWFWLVGYLAGKALRAAITGDKPKALHHCVSAAAAAGNWFRAVKADGTGTCIGQDNDIKPVEIARFDGDWRRDDESVFCALMLVGGHDVPREAVTRWTDEQCRQAHDWALTEHVAASDNDDVQRLPKPEWVKAHPPKPFDPAAGVGDLWSR